MIYTLILDQRMIGVFWTCVDGKCIYYHALVSNSWVKLLLPCHSICDRIFKAVLSTLVIIFFIIFIFFIIKLEC